LPANRSGVGALVPAYIRIRTAGNPAVASYPVVAYGYAAVASYPVVAYGYAPVVPVDPGTLCPGGVAVGPANRCIRPAVVVPVRAVIRIADGTVEPPVRTVIDHAEPNGRTGKVAVPRAEYIRPVIHVDKPGVVVVNPTGGVKDAHPANPVGQAVAIQDIHTANTAYATVVVVVYRDIFHLDDGPVVIVLHIGVVIIPGVKGHPDGANPHMGVYVYAVVDIKIKFAIRIYRKRNTVLDKNKRVAKVEGIAKRNLIVCAGGDRASCSRQYGRYNE